VLRWREPAAADGLRGCRVQCRGAAPTADARRRQPCRPADGGAAGLRRGSRAAARLSLIGRVREVALGSVEACTQRGDTVCATEQQLRSMWPGPSAVEAVVQMMPICQPQHGEVQRCEHGARRCADIKGLRCAAWC